MKTSLTNNYAVTISIGSLKSTIDPNWETKFYIDHEDDEKKKKTYILFKVFDNEIVHDEHIEIACGIFELNEILSSPANANTKRLKEGGSIKITAEETKEELGSLKLKLSGETLINARGTKKKTIPFYQFQRIDYGDK